MVGVVAGSGIKLASHSSSMTKVDMMIRAISVRCYVSVYSCYVVAEGYRLFLSRPLV
jgi:hypothetical protein